MSRTAKHLIVVAAAVALMTVVIRGIFDAPSIAIESAEPVLVARSGSSAAPSDLESARRAPSVAPVVAQPAVGAPHHSITAADWIALLQPVRDADPGRRKRWLRRRVDYLGAGLVKALLRAPGDDEDKIALAAAGLVHERDPLVQAVLIEFLGLHADSDVALATLDQCVPQLIADPTRPVHASLAVDGLLSALSRHGLDPSGLFQLADAPAVDSRIRRDLWLGLAVYGFDFDSVASLVSAGLEHGDDDARFGASEALRLFALDGAMEPAALVETLAPVILSEDNERNRLLFLETLGAVGGEHAVAVYEEILRDGTSDDRLLSLTASALAVHGDPQTSLTRLRELLGGTPAARRAAITALGALPAAAASESLAEILRDPAVAASDRRLALRSLAGKHGVDPRVFLAASTSADVEQRRIASQALLEADLSSVAGGTRDAVRAQLERSLREDDDVAVRTNSLIALLGDEASSSVEVLTERISADPSAEVRGLAAGSLFLMGWARGDASLRERAEAAMSAEPLPVRAEIERQLALVNDYSPEELRASIEQDIEMWRFVDGGAPAVAGQKRTCADKARVLERLKLAMYGDL